MSRVGARDLRLGPLRFLTMMEGVQEDVGGGVESQGILSVLADRSPRGFTMNLPIHAGERDEDPDVMGDRLRRQVRALFNNDRLTAAGLWLACDDIDPELAGWYMIGGGQVTYADGGPTYGDYQLALQNASRVGGTRTVRPGQRVTTASRADATALIDTLGRRAGMEWVNVNAVPLAVAWLPPGATDDTLPGGARPTPGVGRMTQRGLVPGQQWRDALSGAAATYRVPAGKADTGQVAVWDRQGTGTGSHEVANPYGQPSTIPANPFPNPYPRRDTLGWTAVGAATIGYETAGGWTHSTGAQGRVTVNCPAIAGTGVATTAVSGSFRRGRTYRFSLRVRRDTGSGNLALTAGVTGDTATTTVTPATTWDAIHTIDWTPTADRTTPSLTIATAAATAIGFSVNHLACMDVTDLPADRRPAFALYCDGDQPGCAWTGRPDASATTYQAARVNLHPNPDAHPSGATATAYGATLTYGQDRPRRPSQPRGIRVRPANTTGTEACAIWLASAGADLATSMPDPTFRLQGQWVTASAWAYLDLPEDGSTALVPSMDTTAGRNTLGLYEASGGIQHVSTPAAGLPRRTWERIVMTRQIRSQAVTTIQFKLGNGLAEADIAYTDLQLEFGADPARLERHNAFDGTGPDCRFLGPAPTVAGVTVEQDPERAFGWERVFGPDQHLTAGDIPVLDNGLCRVRTTGTSSLALIVDAATMEGGWQEQGMWLPYGDQSGLFQLNTVTGTSLLELSPGRAVLRVDVAASTNANITGVVLVTLQPGWTGPRIEVYQDTQGLESVSPDGSALMWIPHPADTYRADGQHLAVWRGGRTASADVNSGAAGVQSSGAVTTVADTDEPWVLIGRAPLDTRPTGYRATTLSVLRPGVKLSTNTFTSTRYGPGHYVLVHAESTNPALAGYVSVKQDFATQSNKRGAQVDDGGMVVYEPEHLTLTGATASTGDANARGGTSGSYVQAAASVTIDTVSGNPGCPRPGRYSVWIRARSTGSNPATATASTPTGAGSAVNIPVGAAYQWVSLGEVTLTDMPAAGQRAVRVTVNAATNPARFDAVAIFPVERRTVHATNDSLYDGARDNGRQALCDVRQTPVLTER